MVLVILAGFLWSLQSDQQAIKISAVLPVGSNTRILASNKIGPSGRSLPSLKVTLVSLAVLLDLVDLISWLYLVLVGVD